MKYTILENTEKSDEMFMPESIDDLTDLKQGKLDLQNLRQSSFHRYLTMIPKENLEEMNKTGKTTYSLITKTTITLEK